MRLAIALSIVGSAATGCATIPAVDVADRSLAYACNDIILIGRLKNLDYQPVENADDILGHGWVTANLMVRRTVRGSEIPARIQVKYFAHTYFREDRDFMFVLSRRENEPYRIKASQLLSVRPHPASRCE